MYIVFVHVHVKPEYIDEFIKETTVNAQASIQEPGILRFDFLRQTEDPNRFTLVEVYKKPEDQLAHRETRHYNHWKGVVEKMMADPRSGIKYKNIIPADGDWK